MCRNLAFRDALREFSDVGVSLNKKFHYFVESEHSFEYESLGNPNIYYRGRERYLDPLKASLVDLWDCRLNGVCFPNIEYNWTDVRSTTLEVFDEIQKRGDQELFYQKIREGKMLEYVLNLYLDDVEERTLPQDYLFIDSIAELCESFLERFEIAMRLFRDTDTEYFEHVFNNSLTPPWKKLYRKVIMSALMEINFVSRIEHINKDGTSPTNIIYYAGMRHIDRVIKYLQALGIQKHLVYGTGTGDNRCIRLSHKLKDFF
jgi:hypothetical protein